jgi:hypothetical protein
MKKEKMYEKFKRINAFGNNAINCKKHEEVGGKFDI